MKPIIKKLAPFVFVFSSIAIAAGVISKDEVNRKMAAIVAPFNSATTIMAMTFTDLNIDTVRTLDFGVNGVLSKIGPENQVLLNLNNASYHFGNGTDPFISGDASLKFDLVKAFGQTTLNQLSEELEKLAQDTAADYTKKYGDALALDIKMEDVQKDPQGNVRSARLRINAMIDFTKLPTSLATEDVEFRSLRVEFNAAQNGISGKILVAVNPSYKGFNPDQPGLKGFIEKLLNDDPDTYQELTGIADVLNSVAEYLVNHKAEEQPNEPTPPTNPPQN